MILANQLDVALTAKKFLEEHHRLRSSWLKETQGILFKDKKPKWILDEVLPDFKSS
ncbi:MAG: hypothetical protein HQM11_20740 [SAR324 cluster bacterium]|nr:hypothetical protein [SAR324 cluster bacterium]